MHADTDAIVRAFTEGSVEDRRAVLASMPPSGIRDTAMKLAASPEPSSVFVALDQVAAQHAYQSEPELSLTLASACWRVARVYHERYGPGPANYYASSAGRSAATMVRVLQELGRMRESLDALDEVLPWLESVGATQNLPQFLGARVEALIHLQRFTEARRALDEAEARGAGNLQLRQRLDQLMQSSTELPSEEQGAREHARLSDADPIARRSFAWKAVSFLTGGAQHGTESILQVRTRIRTEPDIFLDPVKGHDPAAIEQCLSILRQARDWCRQNGYPGDENDALWGIYLGLNRTERLDEAIDCLQDLRLNLETARRGVDDPVKRAGITSQYPHLFPALCRMLALRGRTAELLDAIEGAKGRVLADVLARRGETDIGDPAFSEPSGSLPDMLRGAGAHYLSFLVGEEGETWAVLVARDGSLHQATVAVGKDDLRAWAREVDPSGWGRRTTLMGKTASDLPERLSPLVSWLEPLADDGLIRAGDHLCYAPDEHLHMIPLHYASFLGRPLAEQLSLSRLHGARALALMLDRGSSRPAGYLAVQVAAQDEADPERKEERFRAVVDGLSGHLRSGATLSGTKADLDALRRQELRSRVIHFATHGTFPEEGASGIDKNPYRNSGLLLAEGGALPRRGAGKASLLSPRNLLEDDPPWDLTGSHVTLQACVSGLAREGVGGDALGLEWALLMSGAESVLSTHWHVEVEATADFAKRFYEAWLGRGRARGAAWREAALELAAEHEGNPYYWAAFSLSGDWR